MAAGVEARVPLLDESMLKLALSIPSSRKLGNLQSKVLLRDALRTHLPKEIVNQSPDLASLMVTGSKKTYGSQLGPNDVHRIPEPICSMRLKLDQD